ncbi:hypothetical protein KC343_g9926, partial [Hortaea werneckii]
ITKEQADWFFGLPEKARKQYFSQEERTILTKQCQQALDTAAYELSQLPGYISLESDATKSFQVADSEIPHDTSEEPVVEASTEAVESNGTESRTLEPSPEIFSGNYYKLKTERCAIIASVMYASTSPTSASKETFPPSPVSEANSTAANQARSSTCTTIPNNTWLSNVFEIITTL